MGLVTGVLLGGLVLVAGLAAYAAACAAVLLYARPPRDGSLAPAEDLAVLLVLPFVVAVLVAAARR